VENPFCVIYSVVARECDHNFEPSDEVAGGEMNLENENHDERLGKQLLRLLQSIEASGRSVLPGTNDELLESIVQTAARIFGAAAASILLVNEEAEALEFKVAFGPSDQNLVGKMFPYDQGIAGYVFMTGNPIATSNVHEDKRFNQDFAKSTGYVPQSILATPLLSTDERVIGVMEVLDKLDKSTFDMQDMELMGIFAQQAAMAIDQSQQIKNINEAMIMGLRRLVKANFRKDAAELLEVFNEGLEADNQNLELLELADLFGEISALGEAERKVCLDVLSSFAEYRKSTSVPHRFR